MLDWNDLRHFLAVARSGSTMAAGKAMRISQATVSRRVTALEEALGITLFARSASGYVLTSRGQAVLPHAEAVEAAMAALVAQVEAESRRLAGSVRITTVEGAANAWVLPAIASFRHLHPDVLAELLVGDQNLDLGRGEADIAIRFGERPTQDSLVVRHLADLNVTFFAPRFMVEQSGRPATLQEVSRFPIVGMTAGGGMASWMDAHVPDASIVHRSNTMSGVIAAVRSGIGAGILPCLMGDNAPDLVRLLPPIDELTTQGWLVTTESARKQPHVRAMIDHIVNYLLADIARAASGGGSALAA